MVVVALIGCGTPQRLTVYTPPDEEPIPRPVAQRPAPDAGPDMADAEVALDSSIVVSEPSEPRSTVADALAWTRSTRSCSRLRRWARRRAFVVTSRA